ncbi:MAG: cache domain-containing protein [Opitutaceae bacterium]
MASPFNIPLRESVRGRLILLVAAIAVPAMLLVAVLVARAYRNERQTVAEQLLGTARAVSLLVDQHIAETEALLKGLALSRSLEERDFVVFDQKARTLVDGKDRWIVLTDLEGQQLVNTRVPPGEPLPKSILDGEFKRTLAAGRTYVSNVVIGTAVKAPVFYVSVPIKAGGEAPLVLSLVFDPAAFGRTLQVDQIAFANIVTVVDRTGTIVARSLNSERFVGRKATPDIVAAITTETSGIRASVTLEGVPVVAAFNRAAVSGWSAAIGAPTSELYASARKLLWLALALSAGLLLVAAGMVRWIARGLAVGVESLAREAEALGRGERAAIGRSGLAETDFVAEAMNKTASQLQKTTGDLQAAVARRNFSLSSPLSIWANGIGIPIMTR